MNWKFTLILLAIVVAFYLFFDFYENKQPDHTTRQENASRVFALDRNQIDALTITDHDQKIELVRGTDNRWTLKSPVADRADQSLIDQLMTNLETLRKDDTLSGKDVAKNKLADFGLQSPRARLLITAHGGHPTELLFGNETVIDGKTYLQLAGLTDIYVVRDELKKLLGKEVNAWRDHRLTDIAATDVTKFVVKNPAGEIELQRDGEHWKLVKPMAARADDLKINDLVSQITTTEVISFVADDKGDTASYGLAEPKGTITLFTAKAPKGTDLLVGNAPPEPKPSPGPSPALTIAPPEAKPAAGVYARMPSRQSIYTIPDTINPVIALKPADLRDHSLLRVNADTVDRVRLTPLGGVPFTLAHKNKAWTLLEGNPSNQPADPALADKLLGLLSGANVVDFVADSAADLAQYGLDHPAIQVKLLSRASDNTAESNAGETSLGTVSFGKGDESIVYARVADEPFIVSVPKALVDEIPLTSFQWQSPAIFQGDPTKVNSLEIAVPNHPVLALTLSDKGAWTAIGKVEGVLNTAKVEGVVKLLARLHAIRWVGPVKPEHGLDKPVETFKFASASDPKSAGRLVLGAFGKDGEAYARVDGKEGAFVISRADYDGLTAEVLPGLTPAVPAVSPAVPMETPVASPAATAAPAPVAAPTAPSSTPAAVPIAAPPATPEPTVVPTPSALPPAMPGVTPTPEASPTPVPTPPAPPTPEPMATATPTPVPEATTAPIPTPVDVPAPVETPTP